MSYDNPFEAVWYDIPSVAWGNAATQRMFVGPYGKKGKVKDIQVHSISASFVGTSTVPEVAIGATVGSNEYGRFRLGTAIGSGYTTSPVARRARQETKNQLSLTDFAEHVALEKADIPADTPFYVSLVAGTGGSPAGTSGVSVLIHWD